MSKVKAVLLDSEVEATQHDDGGRDIIFLVDSEQAALLVTALTSLLYGILDAIRVGKLGQVLISLQGTPISEVCENEKIVPVVISPDSCDFIVSFLSEYWARDVADVSHIDIEAEDGVNLCIRVPNVTEPLTPDEMRAFLFRSREVE